MNQLLKFNPVNSEYGYAVEKTGDKYQVVYVKKIVKDGKDALQVVARSSSGGRRLIYSSPFLADHAIRTKILPLYKKAS